MPIDRSEIRWFPMRVANHRELRIRNELDRLDIENYLPVKWGQRTYGGHIRRVQVPALNLIFVRSTQQEITRQKMFNKELYYLRYKMEISHNEEIPPHIMTVPDREMDSFIKATSCDDDRVQYLVYSDFIDKAGRKVRVIDGDFAGVEGEIKRIHKDRVVVVCIRGIAAVAIQIPFAQLEFIDE